MSPINYRMYEERARQMRAEEINRLFEKTVEWFARVFRPQGSRTKQVALVNRNCPSC